MATVYLLWHSHGDDPYDVDDNAKLLGVYSTRDRAEARRAAALSQPGFRRYPDGFIDPYEIDQDQWREGFAEMGVDGEWVPDPDPPESAP